MKKNTVRLTAAMLVVAIASQFSIISNGDIRLIEFVSIFTIGALSGILLVHTISRFKEKEL